MTTTTNPQKKDLAQAWQICLAVMVGAALIMLPDLGYAAGTDTPIGNLFCIVVAWFTGNTGKGLATIAITIIGIGALLGKVSWGMALIVGIGVAIVFGAAGIVDSLLVGAGSATTCSTNASWTR